MKSDSLDDRMKLYEKSLDLNLIPLLPIVARLDGKAFHTFTRNLERPFCKELHDLMVETTKYLVEETNAQCGYTQSDEITLTWHLKEWKSEVFLGGRVAKMTSILAAMATGIFNQKMPEFLPEKGLALFDARVWNVPTRVEGVNCFVWREQDATRNSIQMAGQAKFSHKALQGKSCNEIQEMLWKDHDINWNDYPVAQKRGTYVQKRTVSRCFSAEELANLPEKHKARENPDLKIDRKTVTVIDMPIVSQVANKEAVIYDGCPAVLTKISDG
jgi:tRNA(His) guanylyltransferase